MQGKQIAANMERKGPHKSMHCNFCKPPGAAAVERPSGPQLETKTKVHLIHQLADLRLASTNNEPGFPSVESEACMCVLEGENPCPKCVPDKNRPPTKKKVCRCPKGAKPHPSMFNETAPKKKKLKEEDDEFWWEKYSREHDAMAKETWAAYMAQRRKEKKLVKCQKEELERAVEKLKKGTPTWYRKLSCQQMMYVEFLSTAIRLDSDENITDRTYFVLGGIGLVPRPSRKFLKKCLSYCHYNAVQFLNQLHLLTKELDPFEEKKLPSSKKKKPSNLYTWNEILIMTCISYLEFPALLREIMDRLPPLPKEKILPQIPYPLFPKQQKKYESPYEEPLWRDRLNWLEKMKIDRLNRCRAHMETKRVKIPPLALVRRPSLIDARPPFLAQIEANERASRRIVKEKKKKPQRKHPISTFNSSVDVTAIAGIVASEISTTDKADTDDICVFLREPKESESIEGIDFDFEEDYDFPLAKEVRFLEETPEIRKRPCEVEDNSDLGEPGDIPFKTPPKTESGATIVSPFPPPDGTPGPPALHFETGKRELDILDNEICKFFPFVSSSRQTLQETINNEADDVELNLKSAAAKLKKLSQGVSERKKSKKKKKKLNKKGKCKKSGNKKTTKEVKLPEEGEDAIPNQVEEQEEEEKVDEEEEEEILENYLEEEDDLEDDIRMTYRKKEKHTSSKGSEISDPDPDTDDEWSTRPPCTPDVPEVEEQKKPETIRKSKKRRKTSKKRQRKKKVIKKKEKEKELKEELKDELKDDKSSRGSQLNFETTNEGEREDTNVEKREDKSESVFRGKVGPLVKDIIRDLAEEGFYCASFPNVEKHPDIQQLILHLKGKILNKKLRNKLLLQLKLNFDNVKDPLMFHIPQLGLSEKRLRRTTWNDKKLVSRLAKSKLDQFYFKVAQSRAAVGGDIYTVSYPYYFGTDRNLKSFYAYMVSKYEDCILKGNF